MSLPRGKPAVVLKEVPEGAILFSTDSEVYFGLNPVALRVWQLLHVDRNSMDEVVTTLHREYPDVSREVLAQDVQRLLDELIGSGLAEVQAAV
jgi:hypothetical protein